MQSRPASPTSMIFLLALGSIIIAMIAAMPCDVMEVDAAQYASMSQDMVKSGDWIHLKNKGIDYLDKPPLIFWMSSISMKVFGISNFAYRFPSFLFTLLALFSIWQLGKLLYDSFTGTIAALAAGASQAFFLMNQDVKTDMYLVGAVIFSVWQLTLFTRTQRWLPLAMGFIGMSVGMLAKGPLGVIVPLTAIGGDLLLRRDWKGLFNWKWLAGIPFFIVPLLPFTIGLYQQFGTEGITFFFWTQSFGRITGQSTWANDTSSFFLVHSFVWAFLPWILIAIPMILLQCWKLLRNGLREPKGGEAIAVSGFVLTFTALSFSKFKLPHYIFIVVPFAALILASQLRLHYDWFAQRMKAVNVQPALFILAGIGVPAIIMYVFPGMPWWVIALTILIVGTGIWVWWNESNAVIRLILPAVFFVSAANLIMNAHFYPELLKYQSTAQASKWVRENNTTGLPFYTFGIGAHAFDFYYGQQVKMIPDFPAFHDAPHPAAFYLFTTKEGKEFITNYFPKEAKLIRQFDHTRMGTLSIPFLNPNTRASNMKQMYLYLITESQLP